MIVKMKFLSISGPRTDIDRVCDVYLSKYAMQLENAKKSAARGLMCLPSSQWQRTIPFLRYRIPPA